MNLETEFRSLADRFRRVDSADPDNAQRQIESGGAWGAKLIRLAAEAGFIELADICPGGVAWPESGPGLLPTESDAAGWLEMWFMFCVVLLRYYPGRLPADAFGAVFSETEPGVYRATIKQGDWKTRAEGYAAVADLLADGCKVVDSRTEPGANSANNSKLFSGSIPENTDVRDLVILLDAERGKPSGERRSDAHIARDFTSETEGSDNKAKSLLSQIRRMKRKGRINL